MASDGGSGFSVAPEQVRAHARTLEDLNARFGAVKAASAHIARNDAAYGLLCGWISGLLEDRHARQDELVGYTAENLSIVAVRLRDAAEFYERLEADNSDLIRGVQRELDGGP